MSKVIITLAIFLPFIAWFAPGFTPLTLHEKCYSESVYVFREADRDVIRISRFWLNNSLNRTTGNYHASLLFYKNGEIVDRKETGRSLSYLTRISGGSMHFTLTDNDYLSGIDNGDEKYQAYLDPYLREGLKSSLHFFRTSSGKIMTGLIGRPRAICTLENRITYPLR